MIKLSIIHKFRRICSITVVVLCLFLSCHRNDVKKPSGHLLSKQQVEEMLLEIHIIEGKARVIIYNESSEKVRLVLNYEMKKLFERYHTNYQQFTDSYAYYMSDAAVSKKMIADITNKLIVLQTEQSKNNTLTDTLYNDKLKNKNYEYFSQYFKSKTIDTLMIE